jgi:hypothetical protein
LNTQSAFPFESSLDTNGFFFAFCFCFSKILNDQYKKKEECGIIDKYVDALETMEREKW